MSLKSTLPMAALLLLCTSGAMAQFTSSIQGIVTDGSGAVVEDAAVQVTNVDSGIIREAKTSSEGLYRVINLGSGTYRVSVQVPGFAPAARPNVPSESMKPSARILLCPSDRPPTR